VTMTKGPSHLRVGGVLPIDESRLKGTRESPAGPIDLALRDFENRYWFPAEAVPGSGGSRLTLTAPLHREPTTREAFSMHLTPPIPAPPDVAPSDVPVTLVIELGRVNLPLAKLADLKPGDVLELARHSKSPVELTSGGRLVARGELVQIDVELGVRVTHVFL
jgi:type III secretion system YscQ/HrcQ family protein